MTKICSSVFILVFLWNMGSYCSFIEPDHSEFAVFNTIPSSLNQSKIFGLPVILWWTGRLFPHIELNRTTIKCSEGSCISTQDRTMRYHPETRVFIFYGSDLEVEDMPLPRLPHHLWALFHEESPLNNFLYSHAKGIRLFNYTATFRRESDYPLTTQFLPSLEYLLERKPYPLNEKNKLRKQGLAPVIYVQSHCHVPSDRDRYVQELSKYVPIDSYGSCLHNKDLPVHINSPEKYEDAAFLDFISQYKFYLAFENAICDDYVTEKLYRALHVGSVPIYKGASTAKDWLPSAHSAIIVDDFDTPAKLAEYILILDSDDKLYQKYLQFKDKGVLNEFLNEQVKNREWGINNPEKIDFFQGFECYVCDQIVKRLKAESNFSQRSLVSPKMANAKHMGCPEPHMSITEMNYNPPPSDEWLKQGWVDAYWFSYDQAKALEAMILNNESDSSQIHNVAIKMRYTP